TDTSGRILAGTANNGLYRQDGNGRFVPVAIGNDLMSRKIHAIVVKGDEIWVGTSYGVYLLSPRGNRHLTTANGLLHNEVNALYLEANGHIWAACNNGGVSVISGDDVKSFTLTEQGNSVHVTGITQDSLGTLWFSTNGNGVRYIKGGVVLGVSKADGLHSDYVQAIASDGHGGIWAAHRGGASRVGRDDHKVMAFADQFGIEPDRRMNAIAKGPYGHMWFATDKGLLRYTSMKDVHSVRTPTAIITGVKVSGRDMPPDRSIDLPPDIYRIQFDFLGISLANPDGVRYRYKLEGYDLDWTETTLGSAHYMRISEGNYTLQVQAAMIGGDFTGNTARLAITVQTPVWKRHWFITLCVIALLAAISGFIRLRERRQRKNRELLKKSLKERTKELQAKSDELEEKNKDITDSITYARRIQQAILPQEDILAEHFPNSFIFYRPRDIVSGDFYWFRRFGTKFILACADCTGHGVPGAFMSMIGSMLLREVSAEKEVNSPDVLLTNLDNELRAVLRYQGENQYNHDGMDISLCEIDVETRLLRSSAAMHDLLILRNGKLLRERGTRRSIGGVMEEGVEQHFNRFEIPLEPGDRIFLFTDGMPDQFGGARGKKLKISGLTEWIEETAPLPMDEQASLLRFRFEEWIGEQAQVDDVLLIGIEV
ncbi:MAG: SpoIIE family protein phosphatase, partial [Flavobacteriales bacterium]